MEILPQVGMKIKKILETTTKFSSYLHLEDTPYK